MHALQQQKEKRLRNAIGSRSIQRFPKHSSKHLTLQLTVLRLDLSVSFLYLNSMKNNLSFTVANLEYA